MPTRYLAGASMRAASGLDTVEGRRLPPDIARTGDEMSEGPARSAGELLEKLRGQGTALPPRAPWRAIWLAALGGALAIAVVAALTRGIDELLILGSFGATCVLVFGFPDAPFSQPRNVVAGHVLSTLCGLLAVEVLGRHWWTAAIAVAAAIAAMMATRTVHPPAGSNPVIVYLGTPGWSFLFLPTLVGAILVVLVALVYNNMVRPQRYPAYW